jgi:hypothetical protein
MNAGRKEVHHCFPAQFAIRDDINARQFLILDRRLDCIVMGFFKLFMCQFIASGKSAGSFQPRGKRIAANDGRWKHGQSPFLQMGVPEVNSFIENGVT